MFIPSIAEQKYCLENRHFSATELANQGTVNPKFFDETSKVAALGYALAEIGGEEVDREGAIAIGTEWLTRSPLINRLYSFDGVEYSAKELIRLAESRPGFFRDGQYACYSKVRALGMALGADEFQAYDVGIEKLWSCPGWAMSSEAEPVHFSLSLNDIDVDHMDGQQFQEMAIAFAFERRRRQ